MFDIDPVLEARLSRFLTSETIEGMTNANGIMQATQRLSSLHKTISSFLPQYIAADEEKLTDDFGSLTPGTFLFADVSGFTALSEKLMEKAGPEGIEVLTKVFNDYFATMLEILAKSEGSLLKFAGDALLTFFGGEGKEFEKAVKAGLRMQRAMQDKFQPIQNKHLRSFFAEDDELPELTMSIGISRGKLFEALVGNMAQRDHMIMGRLPGEADAAEEAGVRDDVIIHEDMKLAYEDVFETIDLGGGFYQIVDNFGDRLGDYEFSMPQRRRAKSSFLFSFDDADLIEDLKSQLTKLENIARFVSSEIVHKLVVTGDHIESENRLATVIFVHFTGFAELLEAWGEENIEVLTIILSRYYSNMQRVIEGNGGVLTRSDPYKLGSKLLITFGAPIAHHDDAERAVITALEMNRQVDILNTRLREELPPELDELYPYIRQRMGITQGGVFAGEVGWRQRREYTVMGDDVNLAARLMSKADFGTVRLHQNIWERINTYFETTEMEPFKAKGKSELVQSYIATGIRKSTISKTSDTPFIGRKVTLSIVKGILMKTQRNPRKVEAISLYGEIGVGKTRLAKEIANSASGEGLGYKVIWATSRAQNTRKSTWATLAAQILDVDPKQNDDQERALLQKSLANLGLESLEDSLISLIFETSDTAQTSPKRPERREDSEVRRNIFDKLSSDVTVAQNKDEMARFRNEMRKRLAESNNSSVIDWDILQRQSSLTDTLIKLLQATTADTPLLIVIDDLHKDNPRALNILKRLLNELPALPIVFILTYEPTRQIDIDSRKIAVADLTQDETYSMVSGMLNYREIDTELWDYIWQNTSGRALFVESLINTLKESEILEQDEGIVYTKSGVNLADVPDDIRGLVISRIDRLPNDARNLVRAGAVFGDRFSASELAIISEIENQGVFLRMMNRLLEMQIFEKAEDDFYRFKHGIAQQAVYEELTRNQRQDLHLSIAKYLEQNSDNEQNTISLVHHLIRGGDLMSAVGKLKNEAATAEENDDADQAIELYTMVLEIYPDDSESKERLSALQTE